MRKLLYALLSLGVFMLACFVFPEFAQTVSRAALPLMNRLSGLSGKVAFPLVGFVAAALVALMCVLRKRAAAVLLCLVVIFDFLWYPLYFARAQVTGRADESAVLALCSELVHELNERGRFLIQPDEALALSREVMDAPAAAKAARYPELMRALRISGIFVPFTGEALVDLTRSRAALPFTAAHELAHMLGVAGEGEANMLAYERCVRYGGAFAYSARLWALSYALDRVENPGEVMRALDGGILADLSSIPSSQNSDYGAIVDLLIAEG